MTSINRHIGLLAILAILMTSCGIYGKYHSQVTEEDQAIAIPSYQDVFQDPYLIALIDTALANNLDLKVAHEHVYQAEHALKAAKLSYLPSINAGGTPVTTFVSPGNTFTNYTFASASWEIDIFGRITNQKRMANASHLQALDLEQATRTQLIAAVAETYYTLLMMDEQIIVADSAVANLLRSVNTMREMKKAGMTDEAAVAHFEGSYFNTRAQVENIRLNRQITENAMRLLLASNNAPIHRGKIQSSNVQSIDSVNLRVLTVRPDVRAAEHQLERAFYNTNYARANCCPSISIGGSIGWASGGLLFNAIGNLLQPIFNGGKLIAQVKIAKSQQQEMQWNYANALLKAGNEVNNALLSRLSYQVQTDDLTARVASMTRALEATQTKMRYGKGTYLEVLTAQNDKLAAELELISNYRNILQSNVNLYHAIGGGK